MQIYVGSNRTIAGLKHADAAAKGGRKNRSRAICCSIKKSDVWEDVDKKVTTGSDPGDLNYNHILYFFKWCWKHFFTVRHKFERQSRMVRERRNCA